MENAAAKETILVVDDNPENIDVLNGVLKADYNIKAALNGKKALGIATSAHPPDLILLDIMMPGMDGYEVCRHLKEDETTKKIPIIFVTAKGEVEDETRGFELGAADYIIKPVSPPIVRERVRTNLRLYEQNRVLEEKAQERTQQLWRAFGVIKKASLDAVYALSRAAEYKDEDTGAHIQRMSNYSAAVARRMGLNDTTVESILYAAPMHDVGKIGIPDSILLKPGKLDGDEWKVMKEHTTFGGNILKGSDKGIINLGEEIALTHHEKWDGSGYPNGLKGEKIPLAGRIVAIGDVFDALTSRRPYKPAFSVETSYAIIKENRGSHFDPNVVDAFFAVEDVILAIKEQYKDEKESLFVQIQLDAVIDQYNDLYDGLKKVFDEPQPDGVSFEEYNLGGIDLTRVVGTLERDKIGGLQSLSLYMQEKLQLGQILLSNRIITSQQLNQALELQKTTKKALGELLVGMKAISHSTLLDYLRLQQGFKKFVVTSGLALILMGSVGEASAAQRGFAGMDGKQEATTYTVAKRDGGYDYRGRPAAVTPFEFKYKRIREYLRKAYKFRYELEKKGSDYWQLPEETEKLGKGDCEDKAIWLYSKAIEDGFDDIRLVIGKQKENSRGFHAWVAWYPEGKVYILDPTNDSEMWEIKKYPKGYYKPYYSFYRDQSWKHG